MKLLQQLLERQPDGKAVLDCLKQSRLGDLSWQSRCLWTFKRRYQQELSTADFKPALTLLQLEKVTFERHYGANKLHRIDQLLQWLQPKQWTSGWPQLQTQVILANDVTDEMGNYLQARLSGIVIANHDDDVVILWASDTTQVIASVFHLRFVHGNDAMFNGSLVYQLGGYGTYRIT